MREDLRYFAFAIKLGFYADFADQDRKNGRTYIPRDENDKNGNVPNHSINFIKIKAGVKTVIWHSPGRQGWDWRAADLFGSRYRNHRNYISLEDALNKEK